MRWWFRRPAPRDPELDRTDRLLRRAEQRLRDLDAQVRAHANLIAEREIVLSMRRPDGNQ